MRYLCIGNKKHMAYIYNEKTGEFINTSDQKPKATTGPTNTRPRPAPTPAPTTRSGNSDGSFLGGCLSAIGVLVLNALPYLIIGGLVSLCS